MNKTIERSPGIIAYGYIIGGGYDGKTKELDLLVEKAAQLLVKEFNSNIVIRFNSDRESGGAWLKNSLKGFDGNCQIGLGGRLRHNGVEGLYATVYLDNSVLKNENIANSGNKNHRYYSQTLLCLDNAFEDLLSKIDRSKIIA